MPTSLLTSIRSTGITPPDAGMTIRKQLRKKWLESIKSLFELKLWHHLCGICGDSLDHQAQLRPPTPNLLLSSHDLPRDLLREMGEFTEHIDLELLLPMILLETQQPQPHHMPITCLGNLQLLAQLCHFSEPSSFLSPTDP